MYLVDNDRLFPTTDHSRQIAKNLYEEIKDLPIISPHGHCDPFWFSENTNFPDAAQLFVIPDHYILRMLVSQGISFNELGVEHNSENKFETNPRLIWKKFSENLSSSSAFRTEIQNSYKLLEQYGSLVSVKKLKIDLEK